ncbi:MAG: oligoendopeptidase F [Caldilineales bacterium]|nr:oligoendopeptidase F [Caldilineales bacterium]
MSHVTVPDRSAIPTEFTWNAESVFETEAEWEAEMAALAAELDSLSAYHGRLSESPSILVDLLQKRDDLLIRAEKVYLYAYMAFNVDTRDQHAGAMSSRAGGQFGRTLAALAFIEPELLQIGQAQLQTWMAEEPRLRIYGHYFDNLFRVQAHVRSAEVEEVMGLLADPFGSVSDIASTLTNADFVFPPGVDAGSGEWPLTQGTYNKLRASPDRTLRRSAWENYHDPYLAFKNTLASNLATSIKQNVFQMRVRRHESTLAASLHENNIPVEVYHNLIATFQRHLPTWHRYFALRKRALNVAALHPYDIWAPLTAESADIPFEQAVEWICRGLGPMGEDYVETVRRGCLEERWIDLLPNEGKTAGAFSWGCHGTHPFIVMSYTGTVFDLSTLAHELGHSMHSYLTWQNQPPLYSNYSLFVAEVASNFHQALTRAYLLDSSDDPLFQIRVLEEAMSNFHRYFLKMPTLARFELEMHETIENGGALTADAMNGRMTELFAEAYGPDMEIDPDRVGITWATFGHLYADYYVYQYATGISGAHALAARVLTEGESAAADYRAFLGAGASLYPLDALRLGGVDMTSPEPVEAAFSVLDDYVNRLEILLA